jgi:hypothetical protein
MARVGEEFPLECPNCGGDIRLIASITDPGPIRKILTHHGEPLEPPPVSPARCPPTNWGELMQVHDNRDVFQSSTDELPSIDIHSLSPLPDARSRQARQAAGLGETPRKREKKATPEGKAMRAIVSDVPLAGLSSIDRAILYSQDQFPVTIGGRHEPSKGIHDRDHRQATGRQHLR